MKVSVIIRTKNEEKWISSCLKSVFKQVYKDFEVIIVDNKSTDKTVEKASAFDVKIIQIEDFLPGKALNAGIREAGGEIIICLSGHCIPVNNQWLGGLVANFDDKNIAGVYGRQEPLSFSSDSDKRDLLIIFGLDKKVQKKDSFFHNANSALRREVWERVPFNEKVTNIEDRVWAKEVISRGYQLIYEPEASVYHYHGIHHDGDAERCRNVVRVLDSLDSENGDTKGPVLDVSQLDILALVPVKGSLQYCGSKPLLEYTVRQALGCKFIDKVVVSTDNPELAEKAREYGAEAPFLRPKELSREYVDIGMVLQYSLLQLEKERVLPDLVVVLEVTYPFRPQGVLDELIIKLVRGGFDSIVPVRSERRSAWLKDELNTKILGQAFMPRQLKNSQLNISLLGLGFITHPSFIRAGEMLGQQVGILEITDPYSHLEVRDRRTIDFAAGIIDEWWIKRGEK